MADHMRNPFWVAVVAVCLLGCVQGSEGAEVTFNITNNLPAGFSVEVDVASQGSDSLDPGDSIQISVEDVENPISCFLGCNNGDTSTFTAFNPDSDTPGTFQISIDDDEIHRDGIQIAHASIPPLYSSYQSFQVTRVTFCTEMLSITENGASKVHRAFITPSCCGLGFKEAVSVDRGDFGKQRGSDAYQTSFMRQKKRCYVYLLWS
eukprot:Gb_26907 [translate_table: standard]